MGVDNCLQREVIVCMYIITLAQTGQTKCLLHGVVGCPLFKGFNVLKTMEICSRHSELYATCISQVSVVEGCPLSGIPLYAIFITYYVNTLTDDDYILVRHCFGGFYVI